MRYRHIAAGLMALGLAVPAAEASPACDLLRRCAAELAAEMATGVGDGCGEVWRAATIQQYRRLSVSPLEQGGPGMCEAVFLTIANNTREFYERRRICNMPIACKPENADDLPALPPL